MLAFLPLVLALIAVALVAGSEPVPVASSRPAPSLPGSDAPLAAAASPLTVQLGVSPTLTEVGFGVTGWCNATGGVPPYPHVALMYGGVFGGSQDNAGSPAQFESGMTWFTAGNYTVTCWATDSTGANVSQSQVVHILAPARVTLAASAASLALGQSVTLTANVHGGIGPFTYLWMNLPTGCAYTHDVAVTCTPTAAGTWTVTVTQTDSLGVTDVGSANVTVAAPPVTFLQDRGFVVMAGISLAVVLVVVLVTVAVLRIRKGDRAPFEPPAPGSEKTSELVEPPSLESERAEPPGASPHPPKGFLDRLPKPALLAVVLGLCLATYAVVAVATTSQTWPSSSLGLVFLPLLFLAILLFQAMRELSGVYLLALAVGGGTALTFALAASTAACTGDASLATALGVPTCGDLTLTAIVAGAFVVLAAGAGAYVLARARVTRSRKAWASAGALAVGLLVVSSVAVATTPPPPVGGYTFAPLGNPILPFPILAGSSFQVLGPGQPGAFFHLRVPAKWPAPAVLYGAWTSSAPVCMYIAIEGFSGWLPPASVAYDGCGTNLTIRHVLAPADWIVQFYLPLENRTEFNATVTITQTVDLVY